MLFNGKKHLEPSVTTLDLFRGVDSNKKYLRQHLFRFIIFRINAFTSSDLAVLE